MQREISYKALVRGCLVLTGLLILIPFVLSVASNIHEEIQETARRDNIKREAISNVELDFEWKTFSVETTIFDFTFRNKGSHTVKDFTIACDLKGNSGTVIGSITTKVIYERLEPRQAKSVSNLNMGEIDYRATKAVCKIVDLIVEK